MGAFREVGGGARAEDRSIEVVLLPRLTYPSDDDNDDDDGGGRGRRGSTMAIGEPRPG